MFDSFLILLKIITEEKLVILILNTIDSFFDLRDESMLNYGLKNPFLPRIEEIGSI